MRGWPKTWCEVSLQEAAEICDYLREPINAKERAGRHGPYPYYGATGQVGWIDGFRQDGEYVLLGEDGAPFLDPLKAKAYLVRGKCWVNNHAHVLRGRDGVCANRYLMHALNAANYRGYANGTTRLKLTQDAMRRLPIRLAPYEEQTRIEAKIDELFSDLDASVTALKRARANLKRYRAAVLKAAVEGKLTAEWRKSNPPKEPADKLLDRILVERRRKWEEAQLEKYAVQGTQPPKDWQQKYREPAKADIAKLPELPESWCWTTAEQLSDETKAITYGIVKLGKPESGGVPTLRSSNVRRLRLELDHVKSVSPKIAGQYKRTFLEGGELLITIRGTLGGIAVAPQVCNGFNVSREVAVIALVDAAFASTLAHFIASETTQNWISRNTRGIAYTGLNIETLKRLPIALAPREEMSEIGKMVEGAMSKVENVEANVIAAGKRSSSLRQAILKRAFEGKLVPQDPNDEPASVLVERIRTRRREDATAGSRAAAQRRGREIAAKGGPRMLTDAERDFLRRDKVETMRILRARRKAT